MNRSLGDAARMLRGAARKVEWASTLDPMDLELEKALDDARTLIRSAEKRITEASK